MREQDLEARTMIIWGKGPEEVVKYLGAAGYTKGRAEDVVRRSLEIRYEEIRIRGRRRTTIGVGTCLACGLLLCLVFGVMSTPSGPLNPRKGGIIGLPALGFLWGLWKLGDGIRDMLYPSTIKGNISTSAESIH